MIEVFNYREVNKGYIKASFSIRLKKWNDFCIYGLTFFEKENTKWINFPSNKVEKDGKIKHFPYLGFSSKEVNESFKNEILKTLESYIASGVKHEDVPF